MKYDGANMRDVLTYVECKSSWTKKTEPEPVISIPIKKSIREGLDEALKPQLAEVEKSSTEKDPVGICQECEKKGNGNKKFFRETEIVEAPQVLMVSLKRWSLSNRNVEKKELKLIGSCVLMD